MRIFSAVLSACLLWVSSQSLAADVRDNTAKVWTFTYDAINDIHGVNTGSGVKVAPNLIVTAAHVLRSTSIVVMLSRNPLLYPAMIVSSNPITDIGWIEVLSTHTFTLIKQRFDVPVGETIYAVGTCEGLEDFSVIRTKVSGYDFAFQPTRGVSRLYIIFPGLICQGFSGGGVFDKAGSLIGIISMRGMSDRNNKHFFYGLAVPINQWRVAQ